MLRRHAAVNVAVGDSIGVRHKRPMFVPSSTFFKREVDFSLGVLGDAGVHGTADAG